MISIQPSSQSLYQFQHSNKCWQVHEVPPCYKINTSRRVYLIDDVCIISLYLNIENTTQFSQPGQVTACF